jgi:hypothetical protein
MNFESLSSIIIVAILSVFGNILFFNYQFRRKNTRDILQEQLTEFLLPLFYAVKEYSLQSLEWSTYDNYEYVEDTIKEPKELLKKITPIIKNKLYLADDELHSSCIEFLKWASMFNENDAFQDMYQGSLDCKIMDDFKVLVEKKYNQIRDKYIQYK